MIYSVSNATQLQAALSKAVGNDRIELSSGHYGNLNISDKRYLADVVIAAKDPAAPPRFGSVFVVNSKNITLDGLDVDFKPNTSTLEWSSAVAINDSHGISLINSSVTGGDSVAGISPNAPTSALGTKGILGYPIGHGVTANRCTDIKFENNDVSHFSAGIRVGKVNGLDVSGNEIFDVRKVPLSGGELSNVLVEGNHFHSIKPWKFGPSGDHGDHVHFWTNTTQVGPSTNITIRDNFLAQGDGTSVLGIYLDDDLNNKGFRNVVIEDNVIHNGDLQGMLMEDVVGLKIRNNTMLQSSGDASDAPLIHLAAGTRDVVIDKNILAGIFGPQLANRTGNNIAILDNVTVQTHNPQAANYAGKLFVNPFADNPSLDDLKAKAGAMIIGYGADATQQDGSTPYIEERHGDGLDLSTHRFEVMNEAGSSANVVWDFGDRTPTVAVAGDEVDHTYAKPGTYVAKATVTSGGEVKVLHKVVEVASPLVLEAAFTSGLRDTSDEPLAVTTLGSVRLDPSSMGNSVRLVNDRSSVKFKSTSDMMNNEEFSISLAFKKDAGMEGRGGRVLYFAGTAALDVTADGFGFGAQTSTGQKFGMSGNYLGIRDRDWHQMTYTFSQEDGRAVMYLDGKEVDRVEGLKGSQYTVFSHDLHLGNPYGPTLRGLVDNLLFVRGALTPDQVRDHYGDFQRGVLTNFRPSPGTEVPDSGGGATPGPTPTPDPEDTPTDTWDGFVLDVADPSTAGYLRGAKVIATPEGQVLRFEGDGDSVHLGRLTEFEASDRIAFSVDYAKSDDDGEAARLVWNHTKLGLTLEDDGLIVEVRTLDRGIRAFDLGNLGLDDADNHNVTVMLDDKVDRLQVLVDDRVVLDERATNFEVNGGYEWGWMLGTPWDRHFDGDVSGFRVTDRFAFAAADGVV